MSWQPAGPESPKGEAAKVRSWVGSHRPLAVAVAVGLGVCVLLALGALLPGPDRTGDKVVVLGDSITEFGQDRLRRELGDDYDLTVDAVFGARTGDRIEAAGLVATGEPDQVVVNLGTNDVVVGTPLDKVYEHMDTLLSALDDVECVHVVTVGENLLSDGVVLPKAGRAVNEEIAEAVSGHPNAQLLHWDELQQATALRRGDPQALTFDGIHPDGDGLQVLAEAYSDVISDCGRPWYLP